MKVDSISGIITASYPWKNCVRRMVNNRQQAQKVQESMERHMLKAGTHAGYLAEMKKSISEGKVRLLSEQEMENWHGPQHYITTFAVIKPESISTKTRVVANSAMRNARARLSLNECMWPGPNALCDLFNCLLFWRAVEVALMTDLKKAYQSIPYGTHGTAPPTVFVPGGAGSSLAGLRVHQSHLRGHSRGAYSRDSQEEGSRAGTRS